MQSKLVAADIDTAVMLAALAGALVFVWPFGALAISALLLFSLPASTPRQLRRLLALVLAICLALLAGARPLDSASSNDIDGYFEIYQNLASGDLAELTHFGGGFEVALPLLMYLWARLLPTLSENGLMFCFALTGALLMLAWVETVFYSKHAATRPALLGLCLLMLNLYFATQLSRQFLSLLVLLFAFTAVGAWSRLFWLVLACVFHVTALPFFLIYLLVRQGWKGWLLLLLACALLRVYFGQLLMSLEILPEAAAEKLVYYAINDDANASSDLGSLRMIALLSVLSIFAAVAGRRRPLAGAGPWLALPWVALAVHLLLLPIPLASLRTTLMVHSVVPGLIAYQMFSGRSGRALMVTLNVLLVYKLSTLALAENFGNLRSTIAMMATFVS